MVFSPFIAAVSAYIQPLRYLGVNIARRTVVSPLNEQHRGKKGERWSNYIYSLSYLEDAS